MYALTLGLPLSVVFQFLRLTWVGFGPDSLRRYLDLLPLSSSKRTQGGTGLDSKKHLSSKLSLTFLVFCFRESAHTGTEEVFQSHYFKSVYQKEANSNAHYLRVLTLKLDCLKMYQRCGLGLVVTSQNFSFNQLKLHWNVLLFIEFFFLVSIQKILQTPSIQIDAQRVCMCPFFVVLIIPMKQFWCAKLPFDSVVNAPPPPPYDQNN